MDKQELIEFLDGEIRSVKENIAFKDGMNWCAQLVERYLDLNEEPEITTQEAWDKIAEIFDDDDPDMLKDVCINVLKAFNGGYPMLVTEGHICTWNPDVGKPEKEELPDYIIEYLDNALTRGKNKNLVLENLYLELFRKDFGHFYSTSDIVLDWIGISGNATRIIDAIRNGYKPYKEPVWVVHLNDIGCKETTYLDKFREGWKSNTPFYYVTLVEEKAHKFTDKQKAEAVATLVDGTVEKWSE
ncbi:hypothetical protein [Tetragenococcus halophilus]|uniref:hypothetical protein n=1 Tax=Tetragenococcus halophilus TaxID=51669 RepID=UPI0034A1961D